MKFGTKAIHEGLDGDPSTGAIIPPIYQTSTYVQTLPGDHKGFEYSRTQNPTRTILQKNIAAIENAKHGLCFASGMGAIDAIIKLLEPGDEVISNNDLYGGTYRIFTQIFDKYGIKFHFIDMDDANTVENYVNTNTKLIWLETPSNPLMNIIDIKAVSAIAKKHNELFLPNKSNPILLSTMPRETQNLILHVRDESHRFAINYHRKLRSVDLTQSK